MKASATYGLIAEFEDPTTLGEAGVEEVEGVLHDARSHLQARRRHRQQQRLCEGYVHRTRGHLRIAAGSADPR